jgi:hypothetical protein
MTTEKKVKVTPAGPYPLGHAKENKAAEVYAKNGVGVAEMEKVTTRDFTNKKSAYDISCSDPAMTVSIGYNDTINPRGVGVMRGYGAATKGRKISGKMG